ncbi:MAG: Stp1/IreP family PP2C-type Ser/Thr phosphatase [Clostridia bacterium]|nr:Stp1/IreP family PP2C-type Ser/Thr phosphatase [Clostridia bacterium]
MIIASGYTDKGKVRIANEDNWISCEPSPSSKSFYAIVADGMGGHNAGEVASKIATTSISDFINKNYSDVLSYDELKTMLLTATELANKAILDESKKSLKKAGMGTTLVLCFITDNRVIALHVGDSRIYLIRNNTIHRITKDHSLVQELVSQGTITEEEAVNHPQKNIITRALGTDIKVDVDVLEFDSKDEDILILCSDGLSNVLCDTEIKQTVIDSENVIIAPKNLVDRANENGGPDNITAVVLKIADLITKNEEGMKENE